MGMATFLVVPDHSLTVVDAGVGIGWDIAERVSHARVIKPPFVFRAESQQRTMFSSTTPVRRQRPDLGAGSWVVQRDASASPEKGRARYMTTEQQRKDEFREMWLEQAKPVHRYLYKLMRGEKEIVAELHQEVFGVAWDKWDPNYRQLWLTSPPRFQGTLITVARNKGMDWYRQNPSTRIFLSSDSIDLDNMLPPADGGTGDPLDLTIERESAEFVKAFWQALRTNGLLTPTEYLVALMSWDEEKSPKEITQELGLGKSNAVHTHRTNARKKLRAYMQSAEFALLFNTSETFELIVPPKQGERKVAREK